MRVKASKYLRQISLGILSAVYGAHGGLAGECASRQQATMPLTLQNGAVLVSTRVNGTQETLLLDTGAGISALRDDVVEVLGLSRSSIGFNQFSDVEGRSFTQSTSIQTFELGGLKINNLEMLIAPRSSSVEVQDSGIIGADILRRYDIDLNFPEHTATLFDPQHCLPKAAFKDEQAAALTPRMAPGGHLYIPLSLDGKDLEGLIDTGAAVSVLTLDAFHSRFGLSSRSDGVKVEGFISGADRSNVQAYRYSFHQLSIADLTIANPFITLIEDETKRVHRVTDFGSQTAGLPDFILGMSELAKLHIYISYIDNRVYITRPE